MAETDPRTPSGIGAVVSIPYGPVVEWLVGAGYPWVVIDTEHAPIGRRAQLELVTAAHAAGAAAFIRVDANDERAIGFALDVGADGVVVPNVVSVQEARRAAAACHYPPAGNRSIGPTRRQAPHPSCIAQLETVDAVQHAAAIADVEDVTALMAGPGDLALSAGLTPGRDSHHPTMRELYRQVCDAARTAGIPAGTFALTGPDELRQAIDLGWDFIASCLDRLALLTTASQLRAAAATSQKSPAAHNPARRISPVTAPTHHGEIE